MCQKKVEKRDGMKSFFSLTELKRSIRKMVFLSKKFLNFFHLKQMWSSSLLMFDDWVRVEEFLVTESLGI